jgi:glycosyltransferase involved in cell wall biosynthesis
VIADPVVYPEIEHGVTGFHAGSPDEARALMGELAADRELRLRVGAAAQRHVSEHRSAQAAAEQWRTVLAAVAPPALAA